MIIAARLAALGVATIATLSIVPAPDAARVTGGDLEHPGAALFARHCAACHTLGGGPAMGPDLAGVTLRRQGAWLLRWIDDPAATVRTDSAAADLVRQWGGWLMPEMDLTGAQILDLVDFLTAHDAGQLGEDVVASATTPPAGGCMMRAGMGRGMGRGMGAGMGAGPGSGMGHGGPCACPMRGDTTRGQRSGPGHGGHP